MENYITFLLLISEGPWYLSVNGKDTINCGEMKNNACRTLSWLLTLSYKKTHKASLHIVTDVDVVFDRSLLVSYRKMLGTYKGPIMSFEYGVADYVLYNFFACRIVYCTKTIQFIITIFKHCLMGQGYLTC